jgi:hypothetical protein
MTHTDRKEHTMNNTTVPAARWRKTQDAHADCWECDPPSPDEVRREIDARISEVKKLAAEMPDRVTHPLDMSDAGHPLAVVLEEADPPEMEHLQHILANLNAAEMHLADPRGC